MAVAAGIVLSIGLSLVPLASADGAPATAPATAPAAPSDSLPEQTADAPPPVLGAFGVSAGFPSYQTVAAAFSAQYQYVGLQVKASYTAVGPYVGLELRGYPPVPFPVPMFVGLGGGFYGGETTYFATVGAHVPLDLNLRIDVEAGVANVPLLAGRTWAPYLALGVSYAFPFEPTYGGTSPEPLAPLSAVAGTSCSSTAPADASRLLPAFQATLHGFLDSARATYGSIYSGLRYRYDVTSSSVQGDLGTVRIHYSGSVVTIATGRRVSAAGEASASYRWNGCGWSTVSVHY